MDILKIVVTGAYASGKTRFIQSISEIEVVSTEAEVQHTEELEIKNQTTVALDFGRITINPEVALYLFGTPGQERFDFMWEILSVGCIGYLVMVDSTRPAQLREAANVIRFFTSMIDVPFVVVANKQDDPTCLPVEYIRYRLGLPDYIPVLPCVAKERESVKNVLLTLLEMIYQVNEESA
ncbi:MAG TPA: ATP/GTP-binding protein [Chloroflexia bacterium]|nr:ATP/GTP-binding protein [Chloroflexia bacterium]